MISRAGVRNQLFALSETLISRVSRTHSWRILFSRRPGWEETIARGFRLSQHYVTFADLSRQEIARHDLVVPLTVDALQTLHGMRSLVDDNPIPIPSLESVALCDNKSLFNNRIIAAGLGQFIPSVDSSLSYPYILKKKVDEWGKNSHIVTGVRDEQALSDKLASPDYFAQRLIPGPTEYATHLVFRDDEILCHLNVRYEFASDTPIKGRDQPVYTEVCECPYLEQFASILRCVGFEGLCCFNYKLIDDQPYILEINPRFGGSLCAYFFSFVRHLQRPSDLSAVA